MRIIFYNKSLDDVICISNTGEKYVVGSFQKVKVLFENTECSFGLVSAVIPQYHIFKANEFHVLANYELTDVPEQMEFVIEKQEVKINETKKYVRFIIPDILTVAKTNYEIINSKEILSKNKKNIIASHILLFLGHFFSKVNVFFVLLGIVLSREYGIKTGGTCYLVVFSFYFLIIELIDWFQDRNLRIQNFMTDEYIKKIFSNLK